MTRRAASLTRDAMPYASVEEATEAVREARSRLERDADKLPRPVAKTVERVGSKAKSAPDDKRRRL